MALTPSSFALWTVSHWGNPAPGKITNLPYLSAASIAFRRPLITFSCPVWSGTPAETLKSAGPKKTASTPSVARIASRWGMVEMSSIIGMTSVSALLHSIHSTPPLTPHCPERQSPP